MEQKFSIFQVERVLHGYTWNLGRDDEEISESLSERCFIYLDTYNTLDEAKIAQKELKQKSIILPSY